MSSQVPKTALPGRSRSMHDQMAAGLGYFSIALGLAELVVPQAIRRAAGIEAPDALVRGYGAREIANGIAILTTHDATPWIWARVAGDALDIATVAIAPPQRHGAEGRRTWALGALLAVTAIDLFCASCLNAEKGGRKTARADYRNRSGFPQGPQAARGAARDFETPRDIRGPEALRPHATEGARHPAAPSGERIVSHSGAR
ncbi:MAG: cyclase dehydrase [Alphaproteobacteria bacterium]|nr:cyclase dehydrase [Alphaproteobacteria bacterium]